jgi:16S rRNA (cytidine1402-2'-O)-methyltransferase
MGVKAGVLYVVATPIGNLEDISQRALKVLASVDQIAAEDTRHSQRLLGHYGISTPMVAFHEHNEREMAEALVGSLGAGESIALISDAGTPLISDPGFRLTRAAQAAGIAVSPIPGASALTAALSVAGLPTDRFVFEGFLPSRHSARLARLEALTGETRTLVFYESSHRIHDTLADMGVAFGENRQGVIARELTKTFEEVHRDRLEALAEWLAAEPNRGKGEFVVLVEGAAVTQTAGEAEGIRILDLLLAELPVKKAAALAAAVTGRRKNEMYALALARVRREELGVRSEE